MLIFSTYNQIDWSAKALDDEIYFINMNEQITKQ